MMRERLGPYRIERLLAEGGMGAVYLAHHEGLPRPVALKTLLGVSAEALERFAREARALAKVSHPGVLRIHGLDTEAQPAYLVTELVEGQTLAKRVPPGGLRWQEAVGITKDLADALTAVHAAGLLHRDLKPENAILRPDGRVTLLDFGLVREVDAETLTQTGTILGTPAYMAPEQAAGSGSGSASLDVRADVYGLGAVLFFLLSGRAPFSTPGLVQLLNAVIHDDPDWGALGGAPDAVTRALRRALAKSPGDRYPTVASFAEALTEDAPARLPTTTLGLIALTVCAALAGVAWAAAAGDPPAPHKQAKPTPTPEAPAQAPGLDTQRPAWIDEKSWDLPRPGPARVQRYLELCQVLEAASTEGGLRTRLERYRKRLVAVPLFSAGSPDPKRSCTPGFVGTSRLLLTYSGSGSEVLALDLTRGEPSPLTLEGSRPWLFARVGGSLRLVQYGGRVSSLGTLRWAGDGSPSFSKERDLVVVPKASELFEGLGGTFSECAVSPEGRWVALGGGLKHAILLDLQAPGAEPLRVEVPTGVRGLVFVGDRLAIGLNAGEMGDIRQVHSGVMVVSLADGSIQALHAFNADITRLAASPRPGVFAAGDGIGSLVVYRTGAPPMALIGEEADKLAAATLLHGRAHKNEIAGLAFSANGALLYSADGADSGTSALRTWDAGSGERLHDLPLPVYGAEVWDMELSPDGRLLALGLRDGRLLVVAAPRADTE